MRQLIPPSSYVALFIMSFYNFFWRHRLWEMQFIVICFLRYTSVFRNGLSCINTTTVFPCEAKRCKLVKPVKNLIVIEGIWWRQILVRLFDLDRAKCVIISLFKPSQFPLDLKILLFNVQNIFQKQIKQIIPSII